jgi:hypothetical protein
MVEVGDRQHATKLAWRSPLLNKKPQPGLGRVTLDEDSYVGRDRKIT